MKQRFKDFALGAMKVVDVLPQSEVGRVLANQLMRSATSVGANYRAACRGRSKKDFASKISIALEEADESAYWLELIVEGELIDTDKLEPLMRGADELCAILFSAQRSARGDT